MSNAEPKNALMLSYTTRHEHSQIPLEPLREPRKHSRGQTSHIVLVQDRLRQNEKRQKERIFHIRTCRHRGTEGKDRREGQHKK